MSEPAKPSPPVPAKGESKADEKARIAKMRGRLLELRVQGLSLRQCAIQLVSEGSLRAPTEHTAYTLVRYHHAQMQKAAKGSTYVVEAERELYVERLELLYRKVLGRAVGVVGEEKLTPMLQYLNAQLCAKIAEQIAAAKGVQTKPKIEADIGVHEKFDPAAEHARAVIEKQQARASGKFIDVTAITVHPEPKEETSS
jgi:hypothetical protein